MMESLLIAAGIPSAVIGLCMWMLERSIQKRDDADREERKRRQKEADDRESRREEFEFHVLQSVNASVALSEATAKAVQQIPDAHCNGDMSAALSYAQQVKHSQKEFMLRQGIKNVI